MAGGVFFRAATKAYRQAIVNGTKAGVDAEQAARSAAGKTGAGNMTIEEARKILGIDADTTREVVIQKFQRMYDQNEKHGSFYLQSKIYRSMEAIDPDIASKVQEAREAENVAKAEATAEGENPDSQNTEQKSDKK